MTSKTSNDGCITISVGPNSIKESLCREWLLTNSRGGFACGTVASCNTRRYHGLLVGSLNPPANRIVALSTCRELITVDGQEAELGNFEFDGHLSTKGTEYMSAFSIGTGVHFHYNMGIVELTKSIYLLPDSDTVAVVYDFTKVCNSFDFSVRPLVAMRDFHTMQRSSTPLRAVSRGSAWAVRTDTGYTGELVLLCNQMEFSQDGQWWYNFHYQVEKRRGQDHLEDLWSPGCYNCHVDHPVRIVLQASLCQCIEPDFDMDILVDHDIAHDALVLREKEWIGKDNTNDPVWRRLCLAAGQFVVERQIEHRVTPTILAGFPWFLDWGRDTFISLPGLLLSTERFAEAAGVLATFAGAVDEGMIPNRFDDYGNDPHYNSIDASLWFVHSAFEYLKATDDRVLFDEILLPAVRQIIQSYRSGTRFGIHAADDGLITGGDAETQLTWMDAKCNNVAFTPRYGKAVEINALWYNALCNMAGYYRDRNAGGDAGFYSDLAEQVSDSFREVFWNSSKGYLNDCVLPDGTIDASLRPNQIYAVSLPHSPIPSSWQQQVVAVIERELLTPYGLRTLNQGDPRYAGTYQGDQGSRDRAYHQGTVWSHLMGAFIEAFLRVNKSDKISRLEAAEYLQPLLKHITTDGCIGSISEIFDGDEPHTPRGCFAQAWSVAETLRAYKMLHKS